jgi:hypothetical protein
MSSFDEDEALATEMKLAQNAKKVALMILGTAAQKYMMELAKSAGNFAERGGHHHRSLRDGNGDSARAETGAKNGGAKIKS